MTLCLRPDSDARKRGNCSNFRVIIRLQPRRGWLRCFRHDAGGSGGPTTERSLCCHENEVWHSATNPKQLVPEMPRKSPGHSAVTVRRVPVWLAPPLPRPVWSAPPLPRAHSSPHDTSVPFPALLCPLRPPLARQIPIPRTFPHPLLHRGQCVSEVSSPTSLPCVPCTWARRVPAAQAQQTVGVGPRRASSRFVTVQHCGAWDGVPLVGDLYSHVVSCRDLRLSQASRELCATLYTCAFVRAALWRGDFAAVILSRT